MCWYLYGALQGKVDAEALDAVNGRHDGRIVPGTKHDLKMALLSDDGDYRITDGHCDCESDIGRHDAEAAQVVDLAELIAEVSALPGAKTVSFCKTWAQQRNRRESSLKRSETDLKQLLADLEPNTLYTLFCNT